jgi:thiol-disulfide isomerase/thioredoxin
MNIKIFTFSIIFVASIFIGCNDNQTINESVVSPSNEVQEVIPTLPTFHLKTTNNENITIEVTKEGWIFKEYPNKVVLLNFFATWCPPCKAEIPHLNNLGKKYKDDFIVISVLVEENKSNSFVKDFIKEHNVKYPITNSPENFAIASAVGGVTSIPSMFLFNKKGLVYQNYVGAVAEEILNTDILKAMGK